MPSVRLSDLFIASLKTENRTDYWDAKTPSFGVRVGRTSKTFIVKRKNRRITIGRYPDWTLQKARLKAKQLLLQKSAPHRVSLETALDLFVETYLKPKNRASTAKETERILRKHLVRLFHKSVEDITKHDITDILRQLGKTPSTANHLFTASRTFFRWAHRNDYVQVSPLSGLTIPNRRNSRSRVLSDDELKCIWKATTEPTTFNKIVRLLLLTGQRRGEIAALRSDYISNDICTLPNTLTKNGREHAFPIGTISISILGSLPKSQSFIFSARGKPNQPFNGWSKSKATLDKATGVTNWTLHDLRRTFATRLAEMGIAPHVIERLLNHVTGQISGVAAIYNRARYVDEMRDAVTKWEMRLRSILGTDMCSYDALEPQHYAA